MGWVLEEREGEGDSGCKEKGALLEIWGGKQWVHLGVGDWRGDPGVLGNTPPDWEWGSAWSVSSYREDLLPHPRWTRGHSESSPFFLPSFLSGALWLVARGPPPFPGDSFSLRFPLAQMSLKSGSGPLSEHRYLRHLLSRSQTPVLWPLWLWEEASLPCKDLVQGTPTHRKGFCTALN